MAGFMPEGAKPLLVLTGRQGSAKSTTLRMLKKLIDPSGAPLRTLSGSERDLLISAERNHVMAFDNISSLTATMSDALCRLATGSGFATRKLYADAEEFVIEAQALVCLNGIGDFVLRNDLISRSILLDTPEITLTSRKTEAKINSLLETKRPEILGALLMGAHHAFKSYKTTKVANLGRMADFTVWTAAWSRNLIPDQSDMILQMLKDNAKESLAVALNTDAINLPILKLAAKSGPNGWSGTPQELLDAIAILVADDSIIKGKWWPKSASELGKRIERIAPGLLEQGVTVERTRTSEGRYIKIIMKSEELRDKYNAEISLHTHKRR
jgi:energy-coupling factor transporter ATP-binding protein EcfA2